MVGFSTAQPPETCTFLPMTRNVWTGLIKRLIDESIDYGKVYEKRERGRTTWPFPGLHLPGPVPSPAAAARFVLPALFFSLATLRPGLGVLLPKLFYVPREDAGHSSPSLYLNSKCLA